MTEWQINSLDLSVYLSKPYGQNLSVSEATFFLLFGVPMLICWFTTLPILKYINSNGGIAITFGPDMDEPKKMNPNDVGDSLSFI